MNGESQEKAVWFYRIGEQRRGPVTAELLKALARSGKLKANDLIWREGWKEWIAASRAKGLIAPSPAKVAEPAPMPHPIPTRGFNPRPDAPSRGPVAPSNKKICAGCGNDITFSKRSRGEDGDLYCLECDEARVSKEEDPSNESSVPEIIASPGSTLPQMLQCPDCKGLFHFANMTESGICSACASSRQPKRGASKTLIITGTVCASALAITVGMLLFRGDRHPSGEISTKEPSVQMAQSGANQSRDTLSGESRPDNLSAQLVDGRISNLVISQGNSRNSVQDSTKPAAEATPGLPMAPNNTIDQRAAAISAAYGRLGGLADATYNSLNDHLADASHFRDIAQRVSGCDDLLEMLVRVESGDSSSVQSELIGAIRSIPPLPTGRETEIQAIRQLDQRFAILVSAWSNVLSNRGSVFEEEPQFLQKSDAVVTDDDSSALRCSADCAFSSFTKLNAIVALKYRPLYKGEIVDDTEKAIAGADCALKLVCANAQGTLRLLLVVLRQSNASEANGIESYEIDQLSSAGSDIKRRCVILDATVKVLYDLIQTHRPSN